MKDLNVSTIRNRIEQAGVVGCGGAGFPAHVKSAMRVKTVIANGVECEPLLYCDTELMKSSSKEIVEGLVLLGRAVSAEELILAVKEKNTEAIAALKKAASGFENIKIHLLGNYYPAGDEVSLVYEVTGKIVPEGGFPPDVNVLVQNVVTLAKISEAVSGVPFTKRLVTVAGEVERPMTIEAPVGSYIKDLIKAAGGALAKPYVVIVGGPCMGGLISSLNTPVEKTTTGILVLKPDHPLVALKSANPDLMVQRARSVCDQCMDCTVLCPRAMLGHRLDPQRLMTAIAWGNELGANELKTAHLCCECGICGLYACPLGLLPHLHFHRIKKELFKALETVLTPFEYPSPM